jgi:type I restriction enzyme R subunit
VLAKDQTTTQYETEMKRRFIEEPANLKLLIVVSKLLTGFDAPSCTYIYLDNELRDHNLFQAICRTNRLDGEDKDYGHIVDYKELFSKVQDAIAVYTSDELDTESLRRRRQCDRQGLARGRQSPAGRGARGADLPVCAGQAAAGHRAAHPLLLRHSANPSAERHRAAAHLVLQGGGRLCAGLSDLAPNLEDAGYSAGADHAFEQETQFYAEVRAAIKNHSGEELDIKPFEADMRHLINTYMLADPANLLGDLSSLSLTELIIQTGIHDAIAKKLNEKGKLSRNAIAEGIINNVRKTIIRDQLTDPMFYEEMSKLLEDLIKQKRDDTESYEQFLKNAEELAKKLGTGKGDNDVPSALHGNKEATVLYNNLPGVLAASLPTNTAAEPEAVFGDECLELALKLDNAIREKAPAGWKGDSAREAQVLERHLSRS